MKNIKKNTTQSITALKFISILVSIFVSGLSFANVSADWIKRAKLPDPEIQVLENGLKIAWFVKNTIPVFDIVALVKSGYRDDPRGKSGVAQLVSAVMDKGSAGLSSEDLARTIESLGASRSINADDDSFSVGIHGLASDAGTLLQLFSDILLIPDFPEMEVLKERSKMLDRWEHIGDYSQTLAALAFHRIVSSGTTYARGGFFSKSEFEKITARDLKEFHKTHFTPNNTILAVIGNVDKKLFQQALIPLFSKWKGVAPKRNYRAYFNKSLIPKSFHHGVLVHRPGLSQAQVRLGFKGPLFSSTEHYPLVVANALLGESFQSRLNSRIRDELGLTYSVGSSFSYSKGMGVFTISASTRNETVAQLIKEIKNVLSDFKKNPVTQKELNRTKDYLIGSFPLSTSTLDAVASRWLAGTVFELGPNYLNDFIPNVSKISLREVNLAIGKHLVEKKMTVVVSGDKDAVLKNLKKGKLLPFKVLELESLK